MPEGAGRRADRAGIAKIAVRGAMRSDGTRQARGAARTARTRAAIAPKCRSINAALNRAGDRCRSAQRRGKRCVNEMRAGSNASSLLARARGNANDARAARNVRRSVQKRVRTMAYANVKTRYDCCLRPPLPKIIFAILRFSYAMPCLRRQADARRDAFAHDRLLFAVHHPHCSRLPTARRPRDGTTLSDSNIIMSP